MILDRALAEKFVAIALGHVAREYPNKLDHVMTGDGDAQTPRALHPIFYGSYDWHSCVHGYWMLARLRRLFGPDAKLDRLFDAAFTEANVAAETAYVRRPSAKGFDRPYGWAWALMLAAELRNTRWDIQPLADAFVARFFDYLPRLTYAIRAGTHGNTAFALVLADEYARAAGNDELRALLAERARVWFGNDRNAPAWEPSGDDFLSPTLIEALCMKRLLRANEFAAWFASFLPRLKEREPAVLFTPATVSDRSDGKIAHLDGVNLSRAWCMRALGADFGDAPERHIEAALGHVAGDYMGEHWLATFAVLALSAEAA